ncbi:RDD family protein [Streptomyces sp. NPDC020801]|uniref:RDD family protein n=1 Tax=Streptomyces sp. NPDC020801 TaxID=3365093 RepID=UPI0037BAD5E7
MSAPTPAPGDDRPREGYYPDPSIPGYVRYWNGAAWVPGTSRPAPADGEPLSPPPGMRPAPAVTPAVEETGPHFFDEDPVDQPGPAAAQDAGRPEPASAWAADRAHQSGFGGDQDRRVSWGAGPDAAGPDAVDPRAAHAAGPVGHAARAAGTPPASPMEPARDAAPASADGTFVFRRPTTGGAGGATGAPDNAPAPGIPGPGAPADDDGTMTFRPAPGPGHPTGPGGSQNLPGVPAQGSATPAGASGGPGFAAGKAAAARAAAAQAQSPVQAQSSGVQAQQQPRASRQQEPGPAQGAGAQARAASAQAPAAAAAAASSASALPQQPATPTGGPAPTANPVTSGPGGGQSSWAQQVHRLAGADEEQPVAPWKPPVEDLFQAAARRQAAARPAGLGKRLAARLVDTVVLAAVTAVAAVPLGTKAIEHVNHKIDAARLSGRTVTVWLLDGTTATYLGIVLAVLLLSGVLYEALPTAKWGRTLGKKLCGLQVRDIEGHEPPSFGRALRRWLVHCIPGLLGIGVVGVMWCLFDRPWRQCWHDKAAHTFVAG